jgi:2-(1,2-epoxy-1,2-dihydrophenyl)acetyl-CoA isomerase
MADEAAEMVLHEVRDGIAWITLNRPAVANALAPEQRDRLIELFQACGRDPEVRVVVLRSTGRHFCAGADLERIRASRDGDASRVGAGRDRILTGALRLISCILDCAKPVVCAVNGTAAGLGLHLALACDLVVAGASARFFEPFVLRGLVVDSAGAYLLPRLIGLQRAKELAFLGGKLDAAQAHHYGMVNRVVPDEELQAATQELAAALAASATSAIGLSKRLFNSSFEGGREQLFLQEAMSVEMQSRADDVTEGVTAFIQHRDPHFTGH